MRRLAKYLKPFLVGVLLSIALLFLQAISELNLPNYMSRIVNIGIQQSGLEHAAPEAISTDGMALMTTFMDETERENVQRGYALAAAEDKNAAGQAYKQLYPGAADEIYIRTAENAAQLDGLDAAFGTATLTLMNATESVSDIQSIDLSQLYKFQPMLSMIPSDTMAAAREKALANDPSTRNQSGIMLSQAFLKEVGVNLLTVQRSYVLRTGAIMLVIALIGGICTVLVSLLSSRLAAGVARNLRQDLFTKIESFSNAEFDKFSTASLITRCTNDVTQVQMLLMMGIRMICYAPIMGIGGILMAVNKSVSMSWIIALACVVLLGLIIVITSIAMPRFKIVQKLVDKLNLVARENLSGMMVIRAFGTQSYEEARFDKANTDLTKLNLFINRVMTLMFPVMNVIMNGTTLLIVWVGAQQIAASSLQVGDMMAFIQYAMQIIMSFLMISMMFIMVPRAAVSAARIADVLDVEEAIKDPKEPKSFDPAKKGVVEFDHVSFRYGGAEEDALHDISFTALPGQTTAIIGSTGSGKSTIVNLIVRLYDVTAGHVRVGGMDVRDVSQKALRQKVGYVPQKGVLLSGTIASNLRYGEPDAGEAEIRDAARIAQALEFIEEKPDGFDSEIAQGGGNVSGGQKQRLSIARALVKKPDVYIFDDSFSALDFKTDAALRNALEEHTRESAVIVIAQRVSTIMNAQQILVLENGRVVGRGTHRELLGSCKEYQEIASSQLSKEELQ